MCPQCPIGRDATAYYFSMLFSVSVVFASLRPSIFVAIDLFIHSFILETYIAPNQETTTQRRSQPSHGQKRRTYGLVSPLLLLYSDSLQAGRDLPWVQWIHGPRPPKIFTNIGLPVVGYLHNCMYAKR